MSASWFHGTAATLAPGETLVPGDELGQTNWPGMDISWGVWVTPDPSLAAKYGSHVYEVEPVGDITDWAEENDWERTPDNNEFVCASARVARAYLGSDR